MSYEENLKKRLGNVQGRNKRQLVPALHLVRVEDMRICGREAIVQSLSKSYPSRV
jgi:hypothetical protein